MHDSEPESDEVLRQEREGGRILYGEERLLTLSASALGDLRQELYEILGPIMAHEILFRFGFRDGSRTARTTIHRRPELTPREHLLLGPQFHMMEGMVKVTLTRLEWEDDFHCIEGVWEESFEADQTLATFGRVGWSSCWMLCGFASGWASEATGRDLICIERLCRAQGADTCEFEIVPAERYPGLARKVEALQRGLKITDRMKPTISRLRDKAFTTSAYLARILQDSADAILTVDAEETIRTWNRGAVELLGYTPEEVVGRHFGFLVPEDLRERGEIEKIRRETAKTGSLRNYETRRLKKNGEEVHVSLTRTSIYDAQGRYAGSSAILRDITERKRLVEQLIQAESLAEVGELAAQVAHEIKNPLAGLSGAIQILAGKADPDDPHADIYEELLRHIDRLDSTVLSLLRYTKPYHPDRTHTDFSLMLDSALSMLEASPDFQGVEVIRYLSPDVGPVYADSQQLIQVLMNVLLNAAQALTDDKRIIVRSRLAGGSTWIEVEDHGAGMSPAVKQKVFKPFFTSRHKGTGLGLAIAKKIVVGHGGSIHMHSEEGRGTRVEIRLPRE